MRKNSNNNAHLDCRTLKPFLYCIRLIHPTTNSSNLRLNVVLFTIIQQYVMHFEVFLISDAIYQILYLYTIYNKNMRIFLYCKLAITCTTCVCSAYYRKSLNHLPFLLLRDGYYFKQSLTVTFFFLQINLLIPADVLKTTFAKQIPLQ